MPTFDGVIAIHNLRDIEREGDMTDRKPTDAVADILASAQNAAEALRALTELAQAAQAAADLSSQLHATAERVEDLIDRLAPRVGCTVDEVYAPLFKAAAAD
jgi:hypothetical protein